MPKKATKFAARKQTIPSGTAVSHPVANRPVMPADYGITKSTKGLLDWNWASERLAKSHNYVIHYGAARRTATRHGHAWIVV
jgi:hypothetical protein